MRVYVAGSSHPNEIARVEQVVQKLRGVGGRTLITSRWIEHVRRARLEGVGSDKDLPAVTASRIMQMDLNDIRSSDAVVLVIPLVEYTHGAFFEAGFAHALHKPILAVGPMRSVFTFAAERYGSLPELIAALEGAGW